MGTVDPTEAIRLKAGEYSGVDKGAACTQSSFKVKNRGFLYIGEQGGRYKAMFKLDLSMPEAVELAGKEPQNYEVGNTGWVTARFTAEEPIPKNRWEKWLEESYTISLTGKKRKP